MKTDCKNKKHEKNTSVCRQSITIVRVGSAAGVEGPHIFLAKGVELTAESMLKKNFARIHKAPIGSFVEMTPNAYMMNKVWMKIAPHLCDGIRAMEGITNCFISRWIRKPPCWEITRRILQMQDTCD